MNNSRFCAVECLGVIPLDSRVVCSVVKRNERVHLIIRVKVCQFMSFLLQKSIPVHFSQPLYNEVYSSYKQKSCAWLMS